ncbi:MAG: hypothetical protein NXI30_19280 [bacterium]|nr:hypothetical protein [bacterium]
MARRDRQDLIDEIVWGSKRGAFESDLGQSLLDVWRAGEADASDIEMIYELTHPLRMKAKFGEEVPFRVPPPLEGDFILGFLDDGRPIRVPRDSLTRGTLIAGHTGAGKSNLLAFHALQWAAMRNVALMLLDMYKTQARHLLPYFARCGKELIVLTPRAWPFNPLQSDDRDPIAHAARFSDILASRVGLPSRARALFRTTIHELYAEYGIFDGPRTEWPCLQQALVRIESKRGQNPAARDAVLDRVGSLVESHPFHRNAWKRGWPASVFAEHSIVLEMKDASESAKQIMLETTLSSIFNDKIDEGIVNGPLSLVIALEDSQRFFSEPSGGDIVNPTVIEQAGLIRGSGLALLGNVQTGIGLPKSLSANMGTRYVGPLGTADDYVRFGGDMGLSREQIQWAKHNLEAGRYIVQTADGRWRHPMLLSIPEVKVPPTVTDEDVAQSVSALDHIPTVPAPEFSDWPGRPVEVKTEGGRESAAGPRKTQSEASDPSDQESQPPQLPRTLKKEDLDYLEAIAGSPVDSTTARDKRLHISAWKGNNMRARLQAEGLIKQRRVNPGTRGSSRVLLEITPAGHALLDSLGVRIEQHGLGRGGPVHMWWVAALRDFAVGLGAKSDIEDESSGARVDVTIRLESVAPVACEVETSPGHEMANIRKDITAGFETIVSLVESPSRMQLIRAKVESEHEAELRQGITIEVARLVDFREVLERLLGTGSRSSGKSF